MIQRGNGVVASDVTDSCGTFSVSRRGNWTPKGPPDRPLQFAARQDARSPADRNRHVHIRALSNRRRGCVRCRRIGPAVRGRRPCQLESPHRGNSHSSRSRDKAAHRNRPPVLQVAAQAIEMSAHGQTRPSRHVCVTSALGSTRNRTLAAGKRQHPNYPAYFLFPIVPAAAANNLSAASLLLPRRAGEAILPLRFTHAHRRRLAQLRSL
jgi:hypothetical protein